MPDITGVDLLTVIFRYVKIIIDESGKPLTLNLNESFVGVFYLRNHKDSELKDFILDFLKKKHRLEKLQ